MSLFRHPALLALEAVASVAVAGIWHTGVLRAEAAAAAPLELTVAVLGENERADGSWEGVDLLAAPSTGVQRFQLSVRVARRARFSVDVIEDQEVARLFPEEKREAILEPGRWYAVPGPNNFYELAGRVRVRMNVAPVGAARSRLEMAEPVGPPSSVKFRLSDGAPFQVGRQPFIARGAARIELALTGAAAPPAP